MSAFGAKRKPRIIQTLDDEDADQGAPLGVGEQKQEKSSAPHAPIKFARRPLKSSSLRKSINLNDDGANGAGPVATASDAATADDEEPGGPVVIRPTIGRSGSTKQKKKTAASSRLSFGPSDSGELDDGGMPSTPKKASLGQRALENNAIKKSSSLQNLPTRFIGGDDHRPRYSKEYLDELQSSTPNTPQNLSSLTIVDDEGDPMALDASELDGATVVTQTENTPSALSTRQSAATILTEAQIREKKERRARLAREADFISLDDEASASEGESGPVSVQFRKKKPESRLIAEDEDLGEGYDEFVEDGGLSVGRAAEREARRRQRREMAELIQAAEEGSDAESDGSEAERRAAYEVAQRRAGMDGLRRHEEGEDEEGAENVIPRMRPLPDLEECLQRMRSLVQGLEDEVTRRRAKVAEMEKEKEDILAREKEVQEVLDNAGARYQALAGAGTAVGTAAIPGTASGLTGQSPLRPIPPGLAGEMPVERGLESFGTTPTTRPDVGELG